MSPLPRIRLLIRLVVMLNLSTAGREREHADERCKGGVHLLVLVFVSPFMSHLAQVMKCRVPFLEAAMHKKLCDHGLLTEPAQ